MEYQDFETFSEEKKESKKPKRIYWLVLVLIIISLFFLFLWGRNIYLDSISHETIEDTIKETVIKEVVEDISPINDDLINNSITDLSNIDTTEVTNGQILSWDGGSWVPSI